MIWEYAQDGPPLPDWSILERLTPGVAYALLGTIVVVTLLFHFGSTLRERLSGKSEPPKPVGPPSTASPASALPQAVDSATSAYQSFIDHLRGQLVAQEQEHAQEQARLALERDQARREASDLRVEVQQLRQMLWQRGSQ